MKAFRALMLVSMIVFLSIIVLPVIAYEVPEAGVKKGDWIEYNIAITGPALDQARNLTWFRNEILQVNGTSFEANMTSISVNRTIVSTVWTFNLTGGEVCGWMIIPANLSVGDQLLDTSKGANITVEGQMQKIVAGATRTLTYANDPGKLYKEWDKATGVYVNSLEHTQNYTVVTNATATNLWQPEKSSANQAIPSALITIIIALAGVILLASAAFVKLKQKAKHALSFSQRKIALLTIFTVVGGEIAFILFFPFNEVNLSFAEINLVFQTFWTGLVFASYWYRTKGNYFLHAELMIIVMSAWVVGFSAVLTMDPLSSNPALVSSSSVRIVMNAMHAVFSVPALVFGLWLVAHGALAQRCLQPKAAESHSH